MTIAELIKKLKEKPQNAEVQFAVWTVDEGDLVCAEMSGTMTRDLMKVFAKHCPEGKK